MRFFASGILSPFGTSRGDQGGSGTVPRRLARVDVPPLPAVLALHLAAPNEFAVAFFGDEDAGGVVSAAAAEDVASIGAQGCPVAFPSGRPQRTCDRESKVTRWNANTRWPRAFFTFGRVPREPMLLTRGPAGGSVRIPSKIFRVGKIAGVSPRNRSAGIVMGRAIQLARKLYRFALVEKRKRILARVEMRLRNEMIFRNMAEVGALPL